MSRHKRGEWKKALNRRRRQRRKNLRIRARESRLEAKKRQPADRFPAALARGKGEGSFRPLPHHPVISPAATPGQLPLS